jgi:hypothetical protein
MLILERGVGGRYSSNSHNASEALQSVGPASRKLDIQEYEFQTLNRRESIPCRYIFICLFAIACKGSYAR